MRVLTVYLKNHTLECTKRVCDTLEKCGAESELFALSDGYGELYGNDFFKRADSSDIVIAVGGDGTIIHTAKSAAKLSKPVLGINSGHVGFTAGLESGELKLLSRIIKGDFRIENRMLLSVDVKNKATDEHLYSEYALNEAVISRGSVAKTADLLVSINSCAPINYRADGVIAATPTGSTAYSLSAGGPVLDPEINGIVFTPLCPHSINSRSIVMGGDSVITIESAENSRCKAFLCVDGEGAFDIENAVVTIKHAENAYVRLIRIKNDGFYDVFRKKILENNL